MKIIAIIPARWGSTRLPGKPLSDINGKPMIEWVYEAVKKSRVDKVVVATDNQKIYDRVLSFGGDVIMTSDQHQTGTDRIIEAYEHFKDEYEYVINVQGDEPMINSNDIDHIINCLQKDKFAIATLIGPLDTSQRTDRNTVKAYIDSDKIKMFTRSPLYGSQVFFRRHIGIYGFSRNIIKSISTMDKTENEIAESLEQLRWLDNKISFSYAITEGLYKGIDTQKDLDNYKTFLI